MCLKWLVLGCPKVQPSLTQQMCSIAVELLHGEPIIVESSAILGLLWLCMVP
jgi:hypothetical protein